MAALREADWFPATPEFTRWPVLAEELQAAERSADAGCACR